MSIEEILDELGVKYVREGEHHHARPGWLQVDCPLCGKDSNKFHLGYNLSSRHWNCWRCGGLFNDKVLVAFGMPWKRAKEILGSVDAERALPRERSRVSLAEPKGLRPFAIAHRRYLESRGLDLETLDKVWEVNQGTGMGSKLGWRVFIPIIHNAQRVSWTTRAIGDRVAQRYLSASASEEVINHKEIVYGQDYCHHSIVIVEGPVDAWKIGPGAGGLFGTAYTMQQVKQILKFPFRYVCFDSSADAQKQARGLCDQLSCFPGVTQNIQLDAKDPGVASAKELRLIRKIARL